MTGVSSYLFDSPGFNWNLTPISPISVHGKNWGVKGQTPVVERPGQRQGVSAASAVNAKGGFWFATYEGGLTGELFVDLLKKLMHRRKKPVRLVVDGLPAHKKACVKEYVASTGGKLSLHFLRRCGRRCCTVQSNTSAAECDLSPGYRP